MWQQIQDNKRRTIIGLFAIFVFFILFGAAFGYVATLEVMGALAGIGILTIVYLIFLIQANLSKPENLIQAGLFEVTKRKNQKLYNVVEEMAIASGLGYIPKVYIMDTYIPNAFAFGIHRSQISVIVTKGLLEMLDRDELQGVIGHEIAHIINKDTSLLLNVSIIVSVITFVAGMFTRRSGVRIRCSRSSGNSGGSAQLIIFIFALIILILAPLLGKMFYLFISRKREFLADACSAQYTRYPEGLASALEKISDNHSTTEEAKTLGKDPLVNASCIVPLTSKTEGTDIFSTHPRTRQRIKILRSMTSADANAYNNAFSKITNSNNLVKLNQKAIETIPIKEVAAVGVAGLVGADNIKAQKKLQEEKADRRRETGDFLWEASGYKIITCECGTKLKIPACYKGMEIQCPHCKMPHGV